MALNPVGRSVARIERMVESELRRGERVEAALPVWIGGTYVPFLSSIVVGVALAAGLATSLGGSGLVITALGAAIGAASGRAVALRAVRQHPVDADALQVFLAVTQFRLVVYEARSWGKPGRLLDSMLRSDIGDVALQTGNFLRPTQLSFLTSSGLHAYEFSGLWDVEDLLTALR